VRVAWATAGTVFVLTIAGLIVFEPNTGHSSQTPINVHQRAQVFRVPKTVKATAAQKAAAVATLDRFVRSAFIRRNLDDSWPLATPHMKLGVSHGDWLERSSALNHNRRKHWLADWRTSRRPGDGGNE